MKNLRTALLPLLVAALAASCSSETKHPNELRAVDSLCRELAKADSLLRSLPKEQPSAAAAEIQNNIQSATEAINQLQDTISIETATFLTEYRSAKKILSTYAEKHDQLRAALDTLSLNCSHLSNDLRNNSLAADLDPVKSVENEKALAGRLIDEVRFLVPVAQMGLKRQDSLAPKVKAYIAEMNQKLAEKKAETQK